MKKGALVFAVLFLISIFAVTGVLAAGTPDVSKAYTCLEHQIGNKTCAKMSLEEQVFSVLSTGDCKNELLNNSLNNDRMCWPGTVGGFSCDLQMTAEAVLALDSVGVNTTLPREWLMNQSGVSTDLNWFLEVDNTVNGPESCNVTYLDNPAVSDSYTNYPFLINANKTLNSPAGSCLSLANDNYWFSISPSCYDRSFQIQCNSSFLSTLVYQDKNSQTYHISPNNQGATGSSISEHVNSFCFKNSAGGCDYLGSLWSSLALSDAGQNISNFISYLTTLASSNPSSFPDSFLYMLTGNLEYETNILNLQTQILVTKPPQYLYYKEYFWNNITGRGRYYDTALALLPFQSSSYSSLAQKVNTESWLASDQMSDGCWDNNQIVTNGFLLYSLWPHQNGGNGTLTCSQAGYSCIANASLCTGTVESQFPCSGSAMCCDTTNTGGTSVCELSGNSCVSSSQCASGSVVSQYSFSCLGANQVCCSNIVPQQACSQQSGGATVCQSNQYCAGGTQLLNLPGLQSGQKCCLAPGTCVNQNNNGGSGNNTATCESNNGLCQSSCPSGYSATSSYTCSNSGDLCCMINSNPSSGSGTSYWWVWVLFVLVVLTVIAILYRDKIKEFLQKMQARKGSRGGAQGMNNGNLPPRFPPPYNRSPQIGSPVPRRILPPSTPPQKPVQRPVPKKRSSEELNEVLEKLKEIGK